MTSSSNVWFGLSSGDRELDKVPEIRAWLQEAVLRMIDVLNDSNFQTQIHETYLNIVSAGTSVLYMEDGDKERVINFRSSPIYPFYVATDNWKRVNTVMCSYEYSYSQMVDEFGEDVIPDDIKMNAQSDVAKTYKIVHTVEKNRKIYKDQPNIKSTNLPWVSVYVLDKTDTVLKVKGYREFPYAVPRWSVINEEDYGRSPAMKALPDVKMLNAMKKVVIRGAQKVIEPAVTLPDNGYLLPLDLTPGGVNFKRPGVENIEPIYAGANPGIGLDIMQETHLRVEQAFFIDQLHLREADRMTTVEVMQRREEYLRVLGPILGRLDDELLRPIVKRTFGIMWRKKLFTPPPQQLSDRELRVEYVSQIAKAQKATEADTFLRVVQSIGPMVELDPGLMQNFDGDKLIRHNARIFGLPEEVMRDEGKLAQMREQQAKQQQAMMQSEMNKNNADAAKSQAEAENVGKPTA